MATPIEQHPELKPFADVKVCNCAWCNLLLLSSAEHQWAEANPDRFQMVAGRVDDRPYCRECLPKIKSERTAISDDLIVISREHNNYHETIPSTLTESIHV